MGQQPIMGQQQMGQQQIGQRHVQNQFMGQGLQQPGQVQTMMQPVRSETIQRQPVIMERISEVEKDIIKPIIHREREQTEIRQVTQPYVEKQFQPERIETRELPAEYRPPIVQTAPVDTVRQYQEERNKLRSSVNILPKQLTVMEERPVVMEEVKKIIREEVQPVIYREVVAPSVIRETKHIYEKVVEAPRVLQEIRPIRPLHDLKSWNVMPGQGSQFGGQGLQQPLQQQQQLPQQRSIPQQAPIQQQPIQQQQPILQQPQQQFQQPQQQFQQPQQQFQQPQQQFSGMGPLFLNREITEIERHKGFPNAFAPPVPVQDFHAQTWGMSQPLSQGSSGWGQQNLGMQQQQPFLQQQQFPGQQNWGYGQQQQQFPGNAPVGWSR
jgi:hypothetical protein